MKKQILFSLVLFITIESLSQPVTQWAKNIGTSNFERGTCICFDEKGNSYIGGSYFQNMIICGDTLPNVIMPPIPTTNHNLIISKLDSSGNCVWNKTGISLDHPTNTPQILKIKYYEGFVYCMGEFQDSMMFDGFLLHRLPFQNNVGFKFIMKLSSDGTIIWIKCFYETGTIVSNIIPTDDGLFVAGSYYDSLMVDTTLLKPVLGYTSGFVLKLNLAGNCVWAKNVGNSLGVDDIAYDGEQNIYLLGNYGLNLNIESFYCHDTILNGSFRNTFFAKYDKDGNFIWGQGGHDILSGNYHSQHLCYNTNGSLYFTGAITSSAQIGSSIFSTSTNMYKDIVCKIDTAGQIEWAKAVGNRPMMYNYPSMFDDFRSGAILLASFNDNIQVENDTVYGSDSTLNVILIYYDTNGNVTWHKYLGGILPYDLSSDSLRIFIIGEGYQNFHSDNISAITNGGVDLFVAKFKTNLNLSIEEATIIKGLDFNLFPNPVEDNSILIFENKNRTLSTIQIFNILGNEEESINTYSNNVLIDKNKYSKGIHPFKIIQNNEVIVNGKFLVL